ncbi:MAG: hypothetical protein LUI06_05555 [Ruminococcus sp.]|nr:hypothetical protein [Ruminococcus sp.]
MKNKILIFTIILCSLAFTSCRDVDDTDSSTAIADAESSSASEGEETSSSESEDVEEAEESSRADESSEAESDESEAEQTEPTQIGYEWVSDTEIMSTDGVISSSYEYKKEGNMLYTTVTITNNGDSDIETSYTGSCLDAVTDLTEIGHGWTLSYVGTEIKAGESVTFDDSWELEEGWSTADVSFYFRPMCTDETNNIEYGMDDNGNGINDVNEEEWKSGENHSSYVNDIGEVYFTLENE